VEGAVELGHLGQQARALGIGRVDPGGFDAGEGGPPHRGDGEAAEALHTRAAHRWAPRHRHGRPRGERGGFVGAPEGGEARHDLKREREKRGVMIYQGERRGTGREGGGVSICKA
jgi:hypothetical protein